MLTWLERTEEALKVAESEITDRLGIIQEIQAAGGDVAAAINELMVVRSKLHKLCVLRERLRTEARSRAQPESTLLVRVV
jgi:hypothetical protein